MASDPSISGQSYFVDRWRKLAFRLRIKGDAKLVLLALVENHATYEDGSNCYPSIDTIVWHTELSRRTVQRSLDLLEERGILKRIPCVGTSNLYEFGDADELERTIPERPARPVRQAPAPARHQRQPDTSATETRPPCQTDTPPVSAGHPPCVSLTPYHSHITPSSNTPSEQAAATRTHESAPAHEGQPAAAPSDDKGEQDELCAWLVDQLKSRKRELVKSDAQVTKRQVRVALEAIRRQAGSDDARVKRYAAERLDYFALRGESRPKSLSTLLQFLASREDWEQWRASAQAAAAAPKQRSPFERDPDDVPKPPAERGDPAAGLALIEQLFGPMPPKRVQRSWARRNEDEPVTAQVGEGVCYED